MSGAESLITLAYSTPDSVATYIYIMMFSHQAVRHKVKDILHNRHDTCKVGIVVPSVEIWPSTAVGKVQWPVSSTYFNGCNAVNHNHMRLKAKNKKFQALLILPQKAPLYFRHLERLTLCWSTRPTPTFHSWLPLWQEVPSQSWWTLFQTLWTGNGATSGKHPICYFVLFEN